MPDPICIIRSLPFHCDPKPTMDWFRTVSDILGGILWAGISTLRMWVELWLG